MEFRLTPEVLEKTSDPVRLYLRETGTVPLLTRQGEIELRDDSSAGRVRKTISRFPVVIQKLMSIGADLKCGTRPTKDLVVFDEEEVTDAPILARTETTI